MRRSEDEMTEKTGKGIATWIIVLVVVAIIVAVAGGYYIVQSFMEDDGSPGGEITLVDDYGRTVTLESMPERIVSVAPTATEILFAVGAGDLVVGVDFYSDYPAEVAGLPIVGTYTLEIETIVALDPDVIVCGDLVPSQMSQIEEYDIPYILLAARTMDDVMNDILLVGNLTGHASDAEQLVADLTDRVDAVTSKTMAAEVDQKRVYLEYFPLWTYGPGSFGNDLISLAGGINIAADTDSEYPSVSSEFVIGQDPEVIIYTVGVMTNTTSTDIAERPGWDVITAVMDDAIYPVDDDITSRYGPRIVDGLEALAEIIHPELFDE